MDAARPLQRNTRRDRRLNTALDAPAARAITGAGGLTRLPTGLALPTGEYGLDRFGFESAALERALPLLRFLDEIWFRTVWEQTEPLPRGRVLFVANRVGSEPWDALLLIAGALSTAAGPRLLRAPLSSGWLGLPWLGDLARRLGGYPAHTATAIELLREEEALLALPEDPRSLDARRPERIGRLNPAFVRLALATDSAIVPVAIAGGEDRAPALVDLEALGRRLGLPELALTPLFPWLGPRGLLPLPARHHVIVGQPIHLRGFASDDDATQSARAGIVQRALQTLLDRALARRPGPWT